MISIWENEKTGCTKYFQQRLEHKQSLTPTITKNIVHGHIKRVSRLSVAALFSAAGNLGHILATIFDFFKASTLVQELRKKNVDRGASRNGDNRGYS